MTTPGNDPGWLAADARPDAMISAAAAIIKGARFMGLLR
jgi:hypothetical protein